MTSHAIMVIVLMGARDKPRGLVLWRGALPSSMPAGNIPPVLFPRSEKPGLVKISQHQHVEKD